MRRQALGLLGAVALASSALAQSAPPAAVDPPFALVQVASRQARFGQQAAVEEFYTKLRAAEAKLNVPGLTDIYVVAQGGRGQLYRSIRVMKSWADLDMDLGSRSADTLRRALGEPEQRRLTTALLNATESVTNEVLRVLPGRSNYRDNGGNAWPFIAVRRDVVKPDMLPQHAVYIEKLRAARAIGGAAPDLQWAVAEGPGFVQGTSMYFKTWAERDQWQNVMVKVYGQAEADRLLASRRETLVSTETFVLRHRPDLSRAAASTTTSSRP